MGKHDLSCVLFINYSPYLVTCSTHIGLPAVDPTGCIGSIYRPYYLMLTKWHLSYALIHAFI